jgi:hypothetical protein
MNGGAGAAGRGGGSGASAGRTGASGGAGGRTSGGSGGVVASGGVMGSGGVMASGGSMGSGGRGSGGVMASGGVMGSGGMTASGGQGGGPAAGGRGVAGAGGAGGVTGSGGNSAACAQYASAYQTELAKAKACNVSSLVNPCTAQAPSTLSCSGECNTFVDASKVEQLKNGAYASWQSAGCEKIQPACPNGCRNPPSSGGCKAILTTQSAGDGASAAAVVPIGDTGMCTDGPSTGGGPVTQ